MNKAPGKKGQEHGEGSYKEEQTYFQELPGLEASTQCWRLASLETHEDRREVA